MPPSKRVPEYREGPEAAHAAESLLQRVLAVPRAELERREAAYKKSRKPRQSARKSER